jgi:leucyl-tRNA synthetase
VNVFRFVWQVPQQEPHEFFLFDVPGYGRTAALAACDALKIRSQNDAALLKQAKDLVYATGFYQGTLLVGKYAGRKVCDAKPLVRADLLAEGLAAAYWEPESIVMSRSGDECVVADIDQWYLKYGEEEWRGAVSAWVNSPHFKTFNPANLDAFNLTLSWLREWACSRSFGLGTRLPWDPQFVIESLSDSTIYMAYYTFAHLLHPGSLDGSTRGPAGLAPGDLDDAAWDFVLLGKELPEGAQRAALEPLRREFTYWYPMDLRVSGKDLIQNHLTMSLYNHAAIWGAAPDRMPGGFFCNGHVLVDGEKMSKSKGNFIMLHEAVSRWGADATRFALADAGDSLEDANFESSTADAAILRLTTEEEWMREVMKAREEKAKKDQERQLELRAKELEKQAQKGYDEQARVRVANGAAAQQKKSHKRAKPPAPPAKPSRAGTRTRKKPNLFVPS